MRRHIKHYDVVALVALATIAIGTLPAAAQAPTDPSAGRITAAAQIDFLNAYSFRGVRQDDTGVIVWPQVTVGVRVYEGTTALKALSVHAGMWNSVHSGVVGSDGPSGERWYQADVYTTVNLALAGGVTVGTTYRAYTSPNDMFTTVKEMSLNFGVDDRAALGRAALRPYALLAFELDTSPGVGQVDGGFEAGKYLEIGVIPTHTTGLLGIAVPVRVGVSLGGYYELAGRDRGFGYISVGPQLAVPLGGRTSLGAWTIHGGVEYQALGETTKALNLGDGSTVVASIGLGWSR